MTVETIKAVAAELVRREVPAKVKDDTRQFGYSAFIQIDLHDDLKMEIYGDTKECAVVTSSVMDETDVKEVADFIESEYLKAKRVAEDPDTEAVSKS